MFNKKINLYILTHLILLISSDIFCMYQHKYLTKKKNFLDTSLTVLQVMNSLDSKDTLPKPSLTVQQSITNLSQTQSIPQTTVLTNEKHYTKQANDPSQTTNTSLNKSENKIIELTEVSKPKTNENQFVLLAQKEFTEFTIEEPFHDKFITKDGVNYKLTGESYQSMDGQKFIEAFYVSTDKHGNVELPNNQGNNSIVPKTLYICDKIDSQKTSTEPIIKFKFNCEKLTIGSKNQEYSFPNGFDLKSTFKISWKDPIFNPELFKNRQPTETANNSNNNTHAKETNNSSTEQKKEKPKTPTLVPNNSPSNSNEVKYHDKFVENRQEQEQNSNLNKTNPGQVNIYCSQDGRAKVSTNSASILNLVLYVIKNGPKDIKNLIASFENWHIEHKQRKLEKIEQKLEEKLLKYGVDQKTFELAEGELKNSISDDFKYYKIFQPMLLKEAKDEVRNSEEINDIVKTFYGSKTIENKKAIVKALKLVSKKMKTSGEVENAANDVLGARTNCLKHNNEKNRVAAAKAELKNAQVKASVQTYDALIEEFENDISKCSEQTKTDNSQTANKQTIKTDNEQLTEKAIEQKQETNNEQLSEKDKDQTTDQKTEQTKEKKTKQLQEKASETQNAKATEQKNETKHEEKQEHEQKKEQEQKPKQAFKQNLKFTIDEKSISIPEDAVKKNAYKSAKEILEDSKYKNEESDFENQKNNNATNNEPLSDTQKTYNHQIVQAAENDVKNESICSTRTHNIHPEFEKNLTKKGYDLNKFKESYGNESQQVTHSHIIETSNKIFSDNTLKEDFKSENCDFLNTATNLNLIGSTKKANMIVTFCNELTNAVKFVSDCQTSISAAMNELKNRILTGTFRGADNVALFASYVRQHPTEAFNQMLHNLGASVGKISFDFLNFLDESDFEKIMVHGINEDKVKNTTKILIFLNESVQNYVKTHNIYDMVEDGTAFFAEQVFSRLFFGSLLGCCNRMPSSLIKMAPVAGKIASFEDITSTIEKNVVNGARKNVLDKARKNIFKKASVYNPNVIDLVETSPGVFDVAPKNTMLSNFRSSIAKKATTGSTTKLNPGSSNLLPSKAMAKTSKFKLGSNLSKFVTKKTKLTTSTNKLAATQSKIRTCKTLLDSKKPKTKLGGAKNFNGAKTTKATNSPKSTAKTSVAENAQAPTTNTVRTDNTQVSAQNTARPSTAPAQISTNSQASVTSTSPTSLQPTANQTRRTLPPQGRPIREPIRRYCLGFTEEEAVELLKKSGPDIKITNNTVTEIRKDDLGQPVLEEGKSLFELLKKYGFSGGEIAKFNTRFFKHIYGIQYTVRRFSCDGIRIQKSGGHRIGKHLGLDNIEIKEDGSIKGTIRNTDKRGISMDDPKNVFPQNLSPLQINEIIRESFNNIVEFQYQPDRGKFVVTGLTNSGIKIKTVMEKDGTLVTSFIA